LKEGKIWFKDTINNFTNYKYLLKKVDFQLYAKSISKKKL